MDEVVRLVTQEGLTYRQLSSELGISYDAARHRVRRRGLEYKPEPTTFRDYVEELPLREALEVALDAVEWITAEGPYSHEVDQLNLGLTGTDRRFLICLWDAHPLFVPTPTLLSNVYFDRPDDPPSVDTVTTYIHRLRKKLKGVGMIIETMKGVGYRLIK